MTKYILTKWESCIPNNDESFLKITKQVELTEDELDEIEDGLVSLRKGDNVNPEVNTSAIHKIREVEGTE